MNGPGGGLSRLASNASIVRTGIFVYREEPFRHAVLSVNDGDGHQGQSVHTDMAAESISESGWVVTKHVGVSRQCWMRSYRVRFIRPVSTTSTTSTTTTATHGVASRAPEPMPMGINSRFLFDPYVFEYMKCYLCELSNICAGPVRVTLVCGWNQARRQHLLEQL